MNSRLIYLYIAIIFFLTGFYLFNKGMVIGVARYKHSKNFQMALDSAYHYGLEDGRKGNQRDNI
jgi:hypothetical protein